MTRNFHFEFIAIFFSVLVHAAIAIPYLSGKFTTSNNQQTPAPLQLAMFKTAPEPVQAVTPEAPEPLTPEPEPVQPKRIVKKQPKPVVKAKPEPKIKPVKKKEPPPPEPELEQTPKVTQPTPAPQAVSPVAKNEPDVMLHELGVIARLEDEYKLTLSKLIDASKHYPRRAQRRNMQGKATVSFVILRDGRVEQIRLIDSTGYKILDKAVVEAIEAISGKLPLPAEIKRQQWKFKIPLSFSLS